MNFIHHRIFVNKRCRRMYVKWITECQIMPKSMKTMKTMKKNLIWMNSIYSLRNSFLKYLSGRKFGGTIKVKLKNVIFFWVKIKFLSDFDWFVWFQYHSHSTADGCVYRILRIRISCRWYLKMKKEKRKIFHLLLHFLPHHLILRKVLELI